MKHLGYTILFLLIMVCIWTAPAEAIPSAGDYTFSSTYVNGTFTSSGTALSVWSFSVLSSVPFYPSSWSGPDPLIPGGGAVNRNDSFEFFQIANDQAIDFGIFWSDGLVNLVNSEAFGLIQTPFTVSAVPESSAGIILATGLLGIAGYRWSQRRREGLQVG